MVTRQQKAEGFKGHVKGAREEKRWWPKKKGGALGQWWPGFQPDSMMGAFPTPKRCSRRLTEPKPRNAYADLLWEEREGEISVIEGRSEVIGPEGGP